MMAGLIASLLLMGGHSVEIVPPEPSQFRDVDLAEEMRYTCDGLESLQRVRCTCYIPTGNRTASGVYPYEGIIASNRANLGKVAALYTLEGEFIGFFECRDTGGAASLRNGTSIDVYRDTLERAYEWVGQYGDYVLIQWIGGDG